MELIKREGMDGVTIRKIAGLADANVALVNYYFGSKEKLISEALKLQLQSFREAFDIFEEKELPPLERLKRFLLSYAFSLQEHPELIMRVIGQNQLFESQAEYADFLRKQGFENMGATLTEIVGPISRERMVLMTRQIFGAVLSPIIKANIHKDAPMNEEVFSIKATLEEQIDLFLDHYFHQYTAHGAGSRG